MPAASRQTDISAGHSSFPPTAATEGSGDVFINGLPALRVGDAFSPHGSPSPSPVHSRSVSAGSGTVFINGIPSARIGDPISCGDTVAQGSPDVFAGG